MRVLTVCHPWAWAIVHGAKRIENRTWGASYRGPLLIHAGKSRARLGDYGEGEPPESALTFGAIIGRVTLVDCVAFDTAPPDVRGDRFAEGPWLWLLADPVPLEPFPMPGQVGLYAPPPGFASKPRT